MNALIFYATIAVIVLGGNGNTRTVIRKRMQSYPLKELPFSEVISELRPLKVLIEIAKSKCSSSMLFTIFIISVCFFVYINHKNYKTSVFFFFHTNFLDGHIKLYTDNKPEPMIEAFDPFVLSVQYVSFASYGGASNEFLYNCISDKSTIDTSNDIPKNPVEIPTNDLSQASLDSKF